MTLVSGDMILGNMTFRRLDRKASAEIDKEAFYRKLLKQIKAYAELLNCDVFICYLIFIYCVHLSICS